MVPWLHSGSDGQVAASCGGNAEPPPPDPLARGVFSREEARHHVLRLPEPEIVSVLAGAKRLAEGQDRLPQVIAMNVVRRDLRHLRRQVLQDIGKQSIVDV